MIIDFYDCKFEFKGINVQMIAGGKDVRSWSHSFPFVISYCMSHDGILEVVGRLALVDLRGFLPKYRKFLSRLLADVEMEKMKFTPIKKSEYTCLTALLLQIDDSSMLNRSHRGLKSIMWN